VIFLALVCLIGMVGGLAIAIWQWQQAERWRRSAGDAEMKAAQFESAAQMERRSAEERIQLLHTTQQNLEHSFRSLASEALQANSQMFLDRSREQVEGVVGPVRETLTRFDASVKQLETARAEAYGSLTAQINSLVQSGSQLRDAAEQLKNALRTPHQRGRWGELQLRRTVELAGMIAHCDFSEQFTLLGSSLLRPDLVVHLPNGRNIAVDSKVSLDAYLKAIDSEDAAERDRLFADHARQVRTHVKALGEKAYWEGLEGSPEFVIAFLPLESIYSAALQRDPELLCFGVEKRVLLATPTTLIAVLFAVAQGWREREFTENAERIRELGKQLYERIVQVHGNFSKLGGELNAAVGAYNSAVWNLESRVLVTARNFRDLQGDSMKEMEELKSVDLAPRVLAAKNWSEE
jgi:DNA recombination protein RmuC